MEEDLSSRQTPGDDALEDGAAGNAPAVEARRASPWVVVRNYLNEHSFGEFLGILAEQYIGTLLRFIPNIEGITLRSYFYRGLFRRLDGFAFIYPGAYLDHCRNISAGRSLAVNTGAFLSARAELTMGDGVLIGPNVVIVTSGHRYDRIDLPIGEQGHEPGPITIGDDCWIGANSVILPGTNIATGTIVGAGSVVTSDTEPYSIVGGVPARCIGYRPQGQPADPTD